MLKFLVFDGDSPASERVLRHACLLGGDRVPLPGEVSFEDGLITCGQASGGTAAVSLQVELARSLDAEAGGASSIRSILIEGAGNGSGAADGGGELTVPTAPGVIGLQTCVLPERARPYLLTLELARHRIMLFLTKLEEWGLFTLSPDEPVMRRFEAARRAFTRALVSRGRVPAERESGSESGSGSGGAGDDAIRHAAETNRLAVRALWLAVDASERLALLDAERRMPDRLSGALYTRIASQNPTTKAAAEGPNPPALLSPDVMGAVLPHKPLIGTTVSPLGFNGGVNGSGFAGPAGEAARDVAGRLDFIQVPIRWREMEPTEGRYSFKGVDQWIEWAIRKAKLPVVAGPLIDFRPLAVPEWLYIWENDYETLRDLVQEHLKAMVTRYRRTVSRWTVLSGVHANDNFRFSFDQMMDLTRLCVATARKLHPAARILVELTQPWGEYYTASRRSLIPLQYAEMVQQAGIQVDGFGLRVQCGGPAAGQGSRDLMELSAMLDQYATLERPITVTAVGGPSEAIGGADADPMDPGSWRGGWTPGRQADWVTAACSIAAAKPYVQSVCWQELVDGTGASEMPHGGLISPGGARKPGSERLVELRAAVQAGRASEHLSEGLLGS